MRRLFVLAVFAFAPLTLAAQVRERPVAFDSAGRVTSITPPLAARLGLRAPLWPVTGDYLDARLYAIGDSTPSHVLVVRRQQEVMERFPLAPGAREELLAVVSAGTATALRTDVDSAPTMISEPVRGAFVVNQSLLGILLFAPYTAAMVADPAGSFASYLLVAGGTVFGAQAIARTRPITRAQNHLSWHTSLKGSAAMSLALFAVGGENISAQGHAAGLLAGGIAGDILGFNLGKPLTDGEAHGMSHGSTVTALLTTGLLGSVGMFREESQARAAALGILGAGVAGYPLGLRYVRRAPYRVTAGDVGAMAIAEWLGVAAVGTLIVDSDIDEEIAFATLTAGYGLGLLAGERILVRKFDHTESESRLMLLGTIAGATMGIALPTLAQADDGRAYLAAGTIGGIVGMTVTSNMIKPAPAGVRHASVPRAEARMSARLNPAGVIGLGARREGRHALLSVTF